MISKNRNYSGNILFGLLVFFALIVFVSTVLIFAGKEKNIQDKIYPNVYIDNQNFGLKSKADIMSFYQQKTKKLNDINFTIIYKDRSVATFSAQTISLNYDGKTAAERAYLIGRSTNLPSRYFQKIISIFNLQKFYFESQIEYDNQPVKDFLSTAQDSYNLPAKNALFKFENNKVVDFRKETNGLKIDDGRLLKDFDTQINNLKNEPSNKKIVLNYKIIEPEIKLAGINNYGIEEFIAEGKSDYNHSIPQRVHNVILAASKFNGILIPKGETFSFDQTIGDISSLTGYQPAYIIKDGKTILGDGGGVCQVSTTFFRAALNAGLPIVERHAHDYRVGYYENDSEPGFDATVFAPSVDLKIKNDTPAYILVETEVDKDKNLLYFRLYGKKDKRKVEISKSILYDLVPALETRYQDDPTLKKGVTKQVDFAAGGAKASFSYKVKGENTPDISQTFYSTYRPWAAVFLVGTAD